jgi:hypothetical protein
MDVPSLANMVDRPSVQSSICRKAGRKQVHCPVAFFPILSPSKQSVRIIVFAPKHGLLNTKFLWEEETRVFPFL